MDLNRSMIEAELAALMEVSTDFARGLSTVAARMKVLKSFLDKAPHNGHQSRVDRATSPIVFRADRSTSVSPDRFKSPVKIKEEKIDAIKENKTDSLEKPNLCNITIKNVRGNYVENSVIDNDNSQNGTIVARSMEQLKDVTITNVATGSANSGASTTAMNHVEMAPVNDTYPNARRSYYVVNSVNGLAIPIDASQIKELGLSNNPVQQIMIQPNKPIEEDILYAMQVGGKNISTVDSYKTSGTDEQAQEILVSSGEESEPMVLSNRVFVNVLTRRKRGNGIKRKSEEERREYNRIRQARYRANQQKRFMATVEREKQEIERQNAIIAANNQSNVLNGNANNIKTEEKTSQNVLFLRKDLVTKTYARDHRQIALQTNVDRSEQMEAS